MADASTSMTIQMRIWHVDEDGQSKIKMAWPGEDHISWVTDREGSVRCHKNLFEKLKGTLQAAGKW